MARPVACRIADASAHCRALAPLVRLAAETGHKHPAGRAGRIVVNTKRKVVGVAVVLAAALGTTSAATGGHPGDVHVRLRLARLSRRTVAHLGHHRRRDHPDRRRAVDVALALRAPPEAVTGDLPRRRPRSGTRSTSRATTACSRRSTRRPARCSGGATSGSVRSSRAPPARASTPHRRSATTAPDIRWCISTAPDGYLYELDGDTGATVWRAVVQIPSPTTNDSYAWASPTLYNGRVYVGSRRSATRRSCGAG